MKPALPTQLKVGPHRYTVEVVPDLRNEAGAACWGQFRGEEQRLLIDGDALNRPVMLAETMLHETVHALDKHYALHLSEDRVRVLCTALLSALLDNPGLWAVVEAAAGAGKEAK